MTLSICQCVFNIALFGTLLCTYEKRSNNMQAIVGHDISVGHYRQYLYNCSQKWVVKFLTACSLNEKRRTGVVNRKDR